MVSDAALSAPSGAPLLGPHYVLAGARPIVLCRLLERVKRAATPFGTGAFVPDLSRPVSQVPLVRCAVPLMDSIYSRVMMRPMALHRLPEHGKCVAQCGTRNDADADAPARVYTVAAAAVLPVSSSTSMSTSMIPVHHLPAFPPAVGHPRSPSKPADLVYNLSTHTRTWSAAPSDACVYADDHEPHPAGSPIRVTPGYAIIMFPVHHLPVQPLAVPGLPRSPSNPADLVYFLRFISKVAC